MVSIRNTNSVPLFIVTNVILTSFKNTVKLLLPFNMRIERLCNLYSQMHFTGALALPGFSKAMGAVGSSAIAVYWAKGSCPLFGTPTNTGVRPANNSRKSSSYGWAQRILAVSPILYCEQIVKNLWIEIDALHYDYKRMGEISTQCLSRPLSFVVCDALYLLFIFFLYPLPSQEPQVCQ